MSTFTQSKRRAGRFFNAPAIAVLMLLATACGQSAYGEGNTTPATQPADIKALCGSKPVIVALTDGYGGDTWRKTTQAEFRDEAARCPNIKKVVYANANGDQQKSNGDINSLVSQGVNVLVSFNDYGDAMLPAFRSARRAGVAVVPYFSRIGGASGRDYSSNVYYDPASVGTMWADWLGANVKSGTVLMLGGPAGASSSQGFMNALQAGLKKYPGIKLLETNFIATNWNPTDAQKAVAGLIAKYPKIDAIASDYGVTTLAAVKSFEQAHLPVPAMVSFATNNEISCKYLADRKSGAGWQYLALDGTNTLVRVALRRAMSSYEGTPNSEPVAAAPYVFADSAKRLDPKCDASAPPDADLSSSLTMDALKKLF
ncbi:substrate-binding domain-containing protein [Paraburkholderia sp. GAS42]|uniref:substrate-binding domain-containing protein n=1 Tax=Paraburkholderia sp. GAS42 TaxID=3035135 RepID=UPI003D201C22